MQLQKDVDHGTWDYPFQVHHTKLANGLSLYPHIHEEVEITVITKGSGSFSINGRAYAVGEGDLLFVHPDDIHLATPTVLEPAAFFSIVFSPACFCGTEHSLIYDRYVSPLLRKQLLFPEHLNPSVSWHGAALALAREIESEASLPDHELLTQSSLLRLWHLFFTHAIPGESLPDRSGARLKTTIEFMHRHLSEPITLPELAAVAGISEGHFSRTFKDYMKLSPMDYLLQIRIRESIRLLKKHDLSIGEIALLCGFNDFSYFSKQFRRVMHCSPRQYQKQLLTPRTYVNTLDTKS